MANKLLRPDPNGGTGLAEADSGIGAAVPNCRVHVHDVFYRPDRDEARFTVSYFWNANAYNTWRDTLPSPVQPFKTEQYSFNGMDEDKPLREQCLDYLLTLPRFSTGWVKA